MKDTRAVIVQLLSNIGSQKEVEQYLRQFSALESTQFAVIKVGGGVVRDDLEALCSALTFLNQVALYPIVVHGAGPQLDAAMASAGVAVRREDGQRVTDPEVLHLARKVFQDVSLTLVDALEEMGTRARPIPTGIFHGVPRADGRYGLVGDVTGLDLEPIRSAIRAQHLPILSSLALTSAGQLLNVNADAAARALAERIEPFKIIFLTPTGGVLDGDGRLVPSINLAEDYAPLMAKPWLTGGMRLKVEEIKQLLDKLPPSSSVALTSPAQLPRELFTDRGSGTLFRRGEQVQRIDDGLDGVDVPRLHALIEECFGKTLSPRYFDDTPFRRIYLTDSYRATAIVTAPDAGADTVPYLDKFAVTSKAQGEGLGGSLWGRLVRDHPRLYWRSRADNQRINPWYFGKADGSMRCGDWIVFWYGIDDFQTIEACVSQVAQRAPSWVASEAG